MADQKTSIELTLDEQRTHTLFGNHDENLRTIEDAFLTFTLKPDGAIDHFTMVAVSPLADFSFDYQDLYLTPKK